MSIYQFIISELEFLVFDHVAYRFHPPEGRVNSKHHNDQAESSQPQIWPRQTRDNHWHGNKGQLRALYRQFFKSDPIQGSVIPKVPKDYKRAKDSSAGVENHQEVAGSDRLTIDSSQGRKDHGKGASGAPTKNSHDKSVFPCFPVPELAPVWDQELVPAIKEPIQKQ